MSGARAPGAGRLHPPGFVLLESGFEETGLLVVDPVPLAVLLWSAIAQHLLEFFHRFGVKDGELAIFQAGMALPGQEQPLNIRRRKRFTAAGSENDTQIEPLHTGRGDLELRLDQFELLTGAALKAFFQRDGPLALNFR